MNDLINKRYANLVIVSDLGMERTGAIKKRHFVLCRCDCGNLKKISLPDIKNGKIVSCGCYFKKMKRYGRKEGNPKHNLCYTKQYYLYNNAKSKCYNKNDVKYKYCGELGIKFCDEWLGKDGFVNFYNWTLKNGFSEEKNSVKRIDPNKDFSPENCIVCTEKESKKISYSDKALEEMRFKIKKWHNENKDYWNEEVMYRILKTRLKKYGTLCQNNREKASWKSGWREIGGKRKYFRSKWEANYARYLEWLKKNNQIKEWKHEPKTFWFEKIKRGCRSYLPDFEVENNNGSIEYHEVKGWFDERSQTKIKRMNKYYPEIKLIVIFQKQYNEIKNKLSKIIEGWE